MASGENKNNESKPAHLGLWRVSARPVGRPRKWETPQALLDDAIRYFEYIDGNPWQVKSANQVLRDNGEEKNTGVSQNVRVLQRAYSKEGFCAFVGCAKFADMKRNYREYPEFLEVFEWIENQITAQQLDGAILRQFDGNIVSRLNGLADLQVNRVSVDDNVPKLDDDDIETLKRLNGLS